MRAGEDHVLPSKPMLKSRQEVSASRDFIEIDEDRDKESTFKIERAYKSKEASFEDDQLKMSRSLGRSRQQALPVERKSIQPYQTVNDFSMRKQQFPMTTSARESPRAAYRTTKAVTSMNTISINNSAKKSVVGAGLRQNTTTSSAAALPTYSRPVPTTMN